jgi:hypothetical protein
MFPETQPHIGHIAQISYAHIGALRFVHKIATNEVRNQLAASCEKPLKTKASDGESWSFAPFTMPHITGTSRSGSPHHKKSQ